MKYISGIINIVVGLFIFSVGYSFLSDYFGGTEEKIEVFESLLEEGEETIGILDSMYTEIKVKSTTTYSSKYFFNVGGKDYSGSFNFDSPDELKSTIKVLYMPSDPTINDVNVEKQLAKTKKEENSSTNLILGFGALLVSLYFLYFRGIRRFMKPKVELETKA